MKVFLVEDSRAILEHVRAVVAEVAGAEIVAEADTESAAIDGIRSTRPDTVILDLALSIGSGIAVLKHARSVLPAARFIILTNRSDSLYRKKCLALGADCFIDKSREFGSLGRHLKDLAGR